MRRLGSGARVGRILASTQVVPVQRAIEMAGEGGPRYVGVGGRIDAPATFEDDAGRPLVLRRNASSCRASGWEAVEDHRGLVRFTIAGSPGVDTLTKLARKYKTSGAASPTGAATSIRTSTRSRRSTRRTTSRWAGCCGSCRPTSARRRRTTGRRASRRRPPLTTRTSRSAPPSSEDGESVLSGETGQNVLSAHA